MSVLQVTKKLYVGVNAEKADITPADGDRFIATDTGVDWFGEGGAWITPSGSPTKEHFYPLDTDTNFGNYRVQNINATGVHNFTFFFPHDFTSITTLEIWGIPEAGAAGAGKDIDLSSDYATLGEDYNVHTETDVGTLYDFTGKSGKLIKIDLSPVFSSPAALDAAGIKVDHNSIGALIHYLGIYLKYA